MPKYDQGRAGGSEAIIMKSHRSPIPALAVFGLTLAAVVSLPQPLLSKSKPGNNCPAWQDNFAGTQLDSTRWIIASGQAPGYIPAYHIGYYSPANVSVGGGFLTLVLNQSIGKVDTNSAGVVSEGALVYTNFKCGYGTYQWTMRMSSTATSPAGLGQPVSGGVSAGFLYVNNSQTEIDFEFSGQDPDSLYLVNWLNPHPTTDPTSSEETYNAVYPFDSTSAFHTYTMTWQAGKITYAIDGVRQGVHTTNVPTAPAYFMINHWGTDSGNWGGTATVGTTRYLYVKQASYTPPK